MKFTVSKCFLGSVLAPYFILRWPPLHVFFVRLPWIYTNLLTSHLQRLRLMFHVKIPSSHLQFGCFPLLVMKKLAWQVLLFLLKLKLLCTIYRLCEVFSLKFYLSGKIKTCYKKLRVTVLKLVRNMWAWFQWSINKPLKWSKKYNAQLMNKY